MEIKKQNGSFNCTVSYLINSIQRKYDCITFEKIYYCEK